MSVHVNEPQVGEIAGVFGYGEPHNHVVILARKSPQTIHWKIAYAVILKAVGIRPSAIRFE